MFCCVFPHLLPMHFPGKHAVERSIGIDRRYDLKGPYLVRVRRWDAIIAVVGRTQSMGTVGERFGTIDVSRRFLHCRFRAFSFRRTERCRHSSSGRMRRLFEPRVGCRNPTIESCVASVEECASGFFCR